MSEDNNIIININGGQPPYSQPISPPQPVTYSPPIDQQVHYQQQNTPMAAVGVQPYAADRADNYWWGLAVLFGLGGLYYSQWPAPDSVTKSSYEMPSVEQSEFPSAEMPSRNPAPPARNTAPPPRNPAPPARNTVPPPRNTAPQPQPQPRPAERSAPIAPAPVSNRVDSKWTSKKSAAFVQKTVVIAQDLQINPNDLFAIMDFESAGINHRKVNPLSGATGLIQFMPSTARGLGTSTEALRNMSEIQQLDYVKKYFQPYKGRIKDLPDVYCAVLWPKCVGKPASYVLFNRGQITYTQNNGFDKNKDGIITKQEITTLVKGRR
jgi:soluble lytic murein transglycosylase-like protein